MVGHRWKLAAPRTGPAHDVTGEGGIKIRLQGEPASLILIWMVLSARFLSELGRRWELAVGQVPLQPACPAKCNVTGGGICEFEIFLALQMGSV